MIRSLLQRRLAERIPEHLREKLPGSYRVVGTKVLVKLKPELSGYEREIGEALLDLVPGADSVFLQVAIEGETRKPRVRWLAGSKESLTLHREAGCRFLVDVRKFMWSSGNRGERERMKALVKPGELVVDMFAGIGYWSVPAAVKGAEVVAAEINPEAAEFLSANAILNRTKVKVLEGDCRELPGLVEGADRIIMGYLFETERFLPAALEIARAGTEIHMHRLVGREDAESMVRSVLAEYGIGFSLRKRKVKSYAPEVDHVVFDIKIKSGKPARKFL